jgi:hypothetical protein
MSVCITSSNRSDWRWLRTSANPRRAGMPAARAAAVSRTAFGTQYAVARCRTLLAR